ncbi:MAG: hypothetical protein ACR2M1_08460 [Gemmatimonadaceae bacterium]
MPGTRPNNIRSNVSARFGAMLTVHAKWRGEPAYPRYRADRYLSWLTYNEHEAKTWKTARGARSWLSDRRIEGIVYCVDEAPCHVS